MNQTNNNKSSRLEITSVTRSDGISTIVLAGDFDLSAAPAARRLLVKECGRRPTQLIIDVSALEFIDSAGLSTFVHAHRSLAADGGTLALTGASARMRRLLEITSLSHLLGQEIEQLRLTSALG